MFLCEVEVYSIDRCIDSSGAVGAYSKNTG